MEAALRGDNPLILVHCPLGETRVLGGQSGLTKYAGDNHRRAVTKTRAALGTNRTAGGVLIAAAAPVAAASTTRGTASAAGSGAAVGSGTRDKRALPGRRGVVRDRPIGVGCFRTMLTVAGFTV